MRIREVFSMSTPSQKKRALNVSLPVSLIEEMRLLEPTINFSHVIQETLEARAKKAREAAWLEENKEAIAGLHAFHEQHGSFADDLRAYYGESLVFDDTNTEDATHETV
jgi:antitoxin CcdA